MSFYKEFPTLQAIEDKLDAEIERIREKMREVKKHPRYADNEAERRYQLELLEREYEKTLAKAEDEFQTELKAIELHLAEQAFSMPNVSAEELEKAQELANIVKFQLMTSPILDDTLALLRTRVKTMNDAEKQAVKMALLSLDIDRGNKLFDEILSELNDTAHMRSISKQLDALKRIKLGGNSLRRQYDAWDYAKNELKKNKSFGSEAVSKEFYENHLKGGRE